MWLRFTYTGFSDPREYAIERDGRRIASGVLQKADTLIIDTTALAKHSYRYKAIRLERGNATIINASVQVTTLDTTSHNVTWQVDTLGVRGTIFDVWAFSKDNIWAVGEIYLKDSTGKEDPVLYNLAKWDGQKWIISRVYYSQTFLSPFRAIYAFAPNDVWVGSTQPMHWTGSTWQQFDVPGSIFNGYIYKIWGTSSSNVFMVGTNGSIAHYNGTFWQKTESGTTVDLEDIWGTDDQHIWATGTMSDYSRSVVLKYDGKGWSTIYDSFGQPRDRSLGFSSVWTNNTSIIYLAGVGARWSFNLSDKTFRRLEKIAQWQSYKIRGVAQNDLFTTNAGSEVLHYNGSTWYLFPELKVLGNGSALWYSAYPQRDFVTIGGLFFTGLYGVPVVLRGSR